MKRKHEDKYSNDRHQRDERQTAQQERAPLVWEPATTITKGDVAFEVKMATGYRGDTMYSVLISRLMDDRSSKYLRGTDMDSVIKAAEEVKRWIANNPAAAHDPRNVQEIQ